MKIKAHEDWLPLFEALASKVRLRIIQYLSEKSMNIKELAEKLGLSSAIVTMHVGKLENAGIIVSERVKASGSVQKLCSLSMEYLEIDFPKHKTLERRFSIISIPLGQYTDYQITPTCGLATTEKVIGYFDDPRFFLDPERVNANILWFSKGYVEYKFPIHLLTTQAAKELEISMELGSEAPGINQVWPSDISFFLNGLKVGKWTSPGDFGGTRGKYTPEWWDLNVGQYGFLKVLRINGNGSYMDGEKISDVTIDRFDFHQIQFTFRIAVLDDAENVGGVTLFGSGFGNYNQDIVIKIYY